jgi:hypothetical protein
MTRIVARQLTVLLLLMAFAGAVYLLAYASAHYQAERNLAELYKAKTDYYRLLSSKWRDE